MLLRLYITCLLCTSALAYPSYQTKIPNGENVPHPCIPGTMWSGVGHENALGAGTRNAFGEDFDDNDYTWDATLCRMDSDKDGKTNGEELGDPDCTWTPGTEPKFTTGITHPGVCEPLGSQQCADKTSFVVCSDTSFDCPVLREPGTFAHEVRFPETPVPNKETTYICMTFEFPSDKEYHLVASDPIIDNLEVMHHTLVFGCIGDESPTNTAETPKECGQDMDKCTELVALWAAGGTGTCVDENMGFLVGGARGYKYAVMEQHWNNPMLRSDYTDASGFTFYLTPNLRPNNAGVLMVGQYYLAIPPNALGYVAEGSCTSDCMEEIMDGEIYITNSLNHMHTMGKAQFTELRRDGSRLEYLARDDTYDYNSPTLYANEPPVKVLPGDEIKTTCVFQSRGKEMTTNFGEATSDEMCLAFLTYYPKENLNSGSTFAHEVRFPETPVPNKETTYICMTFEFPSDKEYHLVASDPIIDNLEVMHHTLVFGCIGDESPTNTAETPKECGQDMDKCTELVALWAAGGTGTCVDENMGFLVGGARGYKYAVMEQHWNNPMLRSDYTDASGFTFYLTPNLRPNNAGVLMVGQYYLAIPPNALGYVAEGSCTSDCMEEIMDGEIYITNSLNHMHTMGKAQFTELRRDGSRLEYLARDDTYDYNSPTLYANEPPVKVLPGDEIKTTCVFQSRGKEMTTNFGEATSDEMCLAFLTYYPKENLNSGRCTAWKDLSHCEVELHNVKRGCDFEQLFDYNNTQTLQTSTDVSRMCTPFVCRQECLNLVRRLKSSPCYSGSVGDLVRRYTVYYGAEEQKAETRLWYSKLDSCDWELFQEGYTRHGDTGVSASATWPTASFALVTLVTIFKTVF